MTREYSHDSLNQEVRSIAGYYVLEKEERLVYRDKEVLYAVGHATLDNSCCGIGGCYYAIVPGYVVGWKTRQNAESGTISEVEPVKDSDVRSDLTQIIKKQEMVSQVEFW